VTREDRIRAAEAELFWTAGVAVEETFVDLARAGGCSPSTFLVTGCPTPSSTGAATSASRRAV